MGSSDVLKWHPVDGWYVADVILTSSLMVVMYSSRRPQIPLQTINVSGAITNIANNKKNIRVVAYRKNILEDPSERPSKQFSSCVLGVISSLTEAVTKPMFLNNHEMY